MKIGKRYQWYGLDQINVRPFNNDDIGINSYKPAQPTKGTDSVGHRRILIIQVVVEA